MLIKTLLYIVAFYVFVSELESIVVWFLGGKHAGIKGFFRIVKAAPISFIYDIRLYITSLVNPIEGIYRAKTVNYLSFKIHWENENPGKPFPVQKALYWSVESRYPEFSGNDVHNFITENNINNLIDLIEKTIKYEHPELIDKWYKVKPKYSVKLNKLIE